MEDSLEESAQLILQPFDDPAQLVQQLLLALFLGLLVGLQRERSERSLAGLRTFPLITVLGTLSSLLAMRFGGWIVAASLLGVVAVIAIGNMGLRQAGKSTGQGTTTEIAILVMFAVGAFLPIGPWVIAVAVGAGVAVLLQFKPELHGLASKLGDRELDAMMRFVLISCVILPVLPNQTYGPFDILNPFEIWLMVVLIVGISLAGYVIYKLFGRNAGILLSGILGGTISSTATTVSYARRKHATSAEVALSTLVILMASAVVYVRVIIEVSVVAPAFVSIVAPSVGAMFVLTVIPAAWLWWRADHETAEMPEQENPAELRSAVIFAAVYAGVLLAMAATKEYIGNQGMYVVAGISGLTDMDAITLSTARLVSDGRLDANDGWRLIVVAIVSNLVFKATMVAAIGGRALFRRVALYFSLPAIGGLLFAALV